MEDHPELISPEIDAIVEHLIEDFQTQAPDIQQEMEMTPAQIAWVIQEQSRLLKLLRKISTLSVTTEAIRATYVDTQGGFVLDVPTWLGVVEQQLNTLGGMRQPDQTAMERAELLRSAIAQSFGKVEIAGETVAELYCLLWEALNDIVTMNKGQIVEEQITCLEEALQIYSPRTLSIPVC